MPWVDLKRIMLSGDKPSLFPLYGTLERQNYKNRLMPARGEGSSERGKGPERAEWGILRLEMFCISTMVVTWICSDTITWKYIDTQTGEVWVRLTDGSVNFPAVLWCYSYTIDEAHEGCMASCCIMSDICMLKIWTRLGRCTKNWQLGMGVWKGRLFTFHMMPWSVFFHVSRACNTFSLLIATCVLTL